MTRILIVICVCLFTIEVASQNIQKIKITDLQKTIAESKTPLIINFFATWCKPCIEEMPYFQEAVKKYEKDSLKLLLVSLDFREEYPNGLSAFINKRKVTAPIAWLDETNADYFCPKVDKKWSGAIPATLFINNKKGYRKFFEEQLSKEKLEKEIKAAIGK
ncbi:MAG: TlpA family protein disulfide reductase [Bacteroidia bacterium]|nr:TlpA family protein disulfide reductase [Bacteroidia bacterium]